MDRALPFLCIYRYSGSPDTSFSRLVKTQASYLIIEKRLEVDDLLTCIVEAMSEKFKAFLLIELWPAQAFDTTDFVIRAPESRIPATIKALTQGLSAIEKFYPTVHVKVLDQHERHPPGLSPIFGVDKSKETGTLIIGLSVPNIYRESEFQPYPIFYRKFLAKTSEAIKRGVFEFMRVQTSEEFSSYLTLGKSRISSMVRHTDQQLAEIDQRMNFLLRITPVNEKLEWENFRKSNYSKPPSFKYRLIGIDPEIEKRKLYRIRLERIEDPTLAFIFRDKRMELEKQLTMLEEREMPGFKHIGNSLYGAVDRHTLAIADKILKQVSGAAGSTEVIGVEDFVRQAQKEMDIYQKIFPELELTIQVRKDVSGIMVSKSNLLVSEDFSVSSRRVEALIQHEVGTHILTYCNGKRQPLRQLYAGFAGYDQLQEGLAVLSEYLVEGLTPSRLRLLAARVRAVDCVQQGATFIETFRMLVDELGYDHRFAFNIAMRVHRGGGLSKDAIYLRGIVELLNYLKKGGDLEVLFTGKFHLHHVPLIQELMYRNILRKPVLPAHFNSTAIKNRLKRVREHESITDLLK